MIEWFALGGIVLLVLGLTVGVTVLLLHAQSAPRRAWQRHVDALERECRFLFLKTTGRKIARMQLVGALGVLGLYLPQLGDHAPSTLIQLVTFLTLVGLGPKWWFQKQHEKRVTAIENQLDSWLLVLANALKANPSLGEAIRASARVVRAPMSQELDVLLKESQLGTPLDRAIIGMTERIGSVMVSGALASLLIGRQTGGNLPHILEESASSFREMRRLEGVVRTKTAEGKSQAFVLGAMPFVLLAAINQVDPHWLDPLTASTTGWIIVCIAAALWMGAIFAARRILAVDI